MFSPTFFRLTALCAFFTVATTLSIHGMPALWSDVQGFEQRQLLYRQPLYRAYFFIVFVHCFLVAASMFGIAVAKFRQAPALISFGLLGYFIFSFTELLRTSVNLIAVNKIWRPTFAGATDPAVQNTLREQLTAFSAVSESLFFLFLIGFTLGNLFYGSALIRGKGLERLVGALLLIWVGLSTPAILQTAFGWPLTQYLGWVGAGYQPLVRAALGLWLWREGYRHYSEAR